MNAHLSRICHRFEKIATCLTIQCYSNCMHDLTLVCVRHKKFDFNVWSKANKTGKIWTSLYCKTENLIFYKFFRWDWSGFWNNGASKLYILMFVKLALFKAETLKKEQANVTKVIAWDYVEKWWSGIVVHHNTCVLPD